MSVQIHPYSIPYKMFIENKHYPRTILQHKLWQNSKQKFVKHSYVICIRNDKLFQPIAKLLNDFSDVRVNRENKQLSTGTGIRLPPSVPGFKRTSSLITHVQL